MKNLIAVILLIHLGPFVFAEGRLALSGATIYLNPTDEPIENGFVLIEHGKIAAVGKVSSQKIINAEIIDCSGKIITAGFWNSHIHFFERKWIDAEKIPTEEFNRQIQEMITRYGFTSVFDIGSKWENTRQIRNRIDSGEASGPRIRTTGEALLAKGAMPPEKTLTMLGFMMSTPFEITEAAHATEATNKLLALGVDGIKIHLQPPPPPNPPFPEKGISVTVAEAHQSGKPVFVHPNTSADIVSAVNAGIDVVAHTTPRSGPWDESLLTNMKERNVALTPTLALWKFLMRHERISTQEQIVNSAVDQLRAWLHKDGTILFGNDLGAVAYDPSDEYTLMTESGMSFRQILASLTTSPAKVFGDSERLGKIAPGFIADMVVLDQDPSVNVRALASVRYTIRNGKVIYQASNE
jgi:imidazolonepropionase-like amidohydrolase